jgi:hypothetical protein
MLQARLQADSSVRSDGSSEWVVATFNPWIYSDIPSLQAGFFAELRSAFPKDRRWKDARATMRQWGKVITPVASLASIWGVDGGAFARGLLDNFAGFSSSEAQKAVAKALRERQQPVLMILDDLDRLTADELLQVFKLVRLVGRLPNVYYLLSYDEQTLIDLINTTDLVGERGERRALDYLEKIVQIRLDLPALLQFQVEQIFYESLDELVRDHHLDLDQSDRNRVRSPYDEVMAPRLRTPRSLRRFFAQVDAFLPAVAGEVDFIDFLLLTWLRVTEPGVYELIQARKDEALGGSGITLKNVQKEDPLARRTRWISLLEAAGVETSAADDILFFLGLLFPAIKRIRDADKAQTYVAEPKPQRVAHVDYFDRFFTFGVPPDDIADSLVTAGLQELEDDTPGTSFSALEQSALADSQRTLRKIFTQTAGGTSARGPVILWLARLYERFPSHSAGWWTARTQTVGIVATLLSELDAAEVNELVQQMSSTDLGLSLASQAVGYLRGKEVGGMDEITRWNNLGRGADNVLAPLYARQFANYATTEPMRIPSDIWYLIWDWARISPTNAKSFVAEQVASSRWDPLNFLARTVHVSLSNSSDSPGAIIGFDLEEVSQLVDVDQVASTLDQQISNSEPLTQDWRHKPATGEALVAFVLAFLRSRRDSANGEGS